MNAGELEKLRKKYLAIVLTVDILGLVLIVGGVYSGITGDQGILSFVFQMVGMIVALFCFSMLTTKYLWAYEQASSSAALLEDAFDEVTYDPDRGIPEEDFKAAHIYKARWDNYDSSGYVSGKYKGVAFEQADINATARQKTRDSNGNTEETTATIFNGRWIIFDYNKSFRALVKVLERSVGNTAISDAADGYVYDMDGFEKVSMENEVFNRKFHALSTTMEDAFYLLTPQVMEELLELEAKEKGKIVFLFKDNRLYVGLNGRPSYSRDLFALFHKVDEEKMHQRAAETIRVIMDFADFLRLDNNLFKAD